MFPAPILKKALCIGISYKGQSGPGEVSSEEFELAGAHNDVWKVHDLLTGCYDYEEENITVLLDANGYTQPTKENILIAMNDLLDNARPGENLFFFFAGHGDQITNLDGTEDDNKDEIILPLDWKLDETRPVEDRERYSQIIIDDDLNDILVKRLPPGCRLTVRISATPACSLFEEQKALFDSCHSGTMMDLPYSRSMGPRSRSPPLPAEAGYVAMTMAPRTTSPAPESPKWGRARRQTRETRILDDDPDGGPSQPQSPIQSPADVARINQIVGSGPLELPYTLARMNPRGRMDPLWRKGTWIIRGETLDKADASYTEKQAVSWSACSDGQSGYELRSSRHENRSGGVMVEAFVEILKSQQYRTYRDILKCLGDRLRAACNKINKGKPMDQWIMQEPQLGSQQKPDLDRLFAP